MQIKSNDHDTCVPCDGIHTQMPQICPTSQWCHNDVPSAGRCSAWCWNTTGLQSPPFSPDGSVIEHLTDLLEPRSHQRVPVPANISEIYTVLVEEWDCGGISFIPCVGHTRREHWPTCQSLIVAGRHLLMKVEPFRQMVTPSCEQWPLSDQQEKTCCRVDVTLPAGVNVLTWHQS